MQVWTVPATVLSVTDADTVRVLLDLGWRISYTAAVRLEAVNAPELSTLTGKAARAFAVGLLPVGAKVTVHSHALDKYGRVLGRITLPDGRDFAQALMAAGHAVTYGKGQTSPS